MNLVGPRHIESEQPVEDEVSDQYSAATEQHKFQEKDYVRDAEPKRVEAVRHSQGTDGPEHAYSDVEDEDD